MNTSETPDTYTLAIAAFNNMPAHFHQPGNGKALLLGISQHLRDDLVRPNVQLIVIVTSEVLSNFSNRNLSVHRWLKHHKFELRGRRCRLLHNAA